MSPDAADSPYRVLARKYRPAVFGELIGQEALVRTLSNAIAGGRLAHAWLFTGVRGVGKTTTARILARALNCVGPDGRGGPTVDPCGECEHCLAIAEDRHVDVLEMDAASRTGVDDIRELIDGVRYRPVSARFKVYIIDEVHMISRQAFNALLKTLEEPPPDVKFIFATTEVRKVPMTVLSRCQRFDLRRIEAERLVEHLAGIVAKEGVAAEPDALTLIARAADGSVRDALSILDQAIAHCGETVAEAAVRDMLGLADRARMFDLFEALMAGDVARAVGELERQYDAGADPLVVLQDLLELTHWLTRVKVVPEAAKAITVAEAERTRGAGLAERLPMPALTRAWQMLLKGLGEARAAPDPLAAAEMALVRLAYAANLPSPAELVRDAGAAGAPAASAAPELPLADDGPATAPAPAESDRGDGAGRPQAALATAPAAESPPQPTSFAELVEMVEARREMVLLAHLRSNVHAVDFAPGRLEIRPTEAAPTNLASELGEKLSAWTGQRWVVVVSGEEGAPTLAQQDEAERARRIAEAKSHPFVADVLDAFAGAEIVAVHPRAAPAGDPESPDEEDPT